MLHNPQITQKQEVPGEPVTEEPHDPEWALPPPPEFGARAWFMMTLERFGFWLACALTVTLIAYLYINADRVPRKAQTPVPSVAEEQGVPTQDQRGLAEALNVPAVEPDTAAASGASLAIITEPVNAAIFIDGNYVGASPLRYVALAEGRHLVSVLKPDYAQLDTVVTLNEASALLQLTLREADDVILAEASEDIPTEVPSATDEADRDETPATSTATEAEPISSPETRSAEDPPDAKPLPVAETEEAPAAEAEEPAVQVGELQINSEPSGASVLVAGQEVGVTPLLLADVQVGAQQIILRLDGYEDFATTVDVVAQQQSTVNGQLKQLLGTLRILVKPWGTIYIDGKLHKEESTIWYVAKLPPGNHRVRVEHPSLGNWEQVVVVPAGEEHAITIDFNKDDSGGQ